MRLGRLAAAALLAACHGDPPPPDACADAPTWDAFAQGYVQTWCLPCHSAIVVGPDRQGAPDGVNFDTWSETYAFRDSLERRATGDADPDVGPMPPQGGVPAEQVERFAEWLACGAEGEDEPPGPCDGTEAGPAVTIGSQADADALCAPAGVWRTAEGLVVEGSATVPCLCAVDGDVLIAGGSAELPLLADVGGSVVVGPDAEAVRAPALAHVGGDVSVVGSGASEVSLPALAHVGGAVRLEDDDGLALVALDALYDVGGELSVRRDPALVSLDLPRLRSTGGDFALEELSGLAEIVSTQSLETVGGSLILRQLPSLVVLDDWEFVFLTSVGGDLVVADNAQLLAVHGFTVLGCPGAVPSQVAPDCTEDAPLPGTLRFEGNAALKQIPGFDNLREIGGDLVLRDDATLQSVAGFVNLERVDGALVLEDLRGLASLSGFRALARAGELRFVRTGELDLAEFPLLAAVDGDLTIDECPKLAAIDGLPTLATVGGGFALTNNAVLASIDGLGALSAVGGDLDVLDNVLLPTPVIEEWLAGLTVGGTVTVDGNGP